MRRQQGWIAGAIVIILIALIVLVAFYGVQHDASLRAQCEAKGGVFLARDRVCLKSDMAIPLSR